MYLAATPEMKAIASQAFSYTGRSYEVSKSYTYDVQAHWDGGSKNDCVLIAREGLQLILLSKEAKNPFSGVGNQRIDIPAQHFIVEQRIFCGKNMGIRFVIRPDEADTFAIATPKEELTRNEKIVLLAVLSLKSTYGGEKNYRFAEARRDTDITSFEYEAAKSALIERGYLTKAGAATVKGKNERSRLPGNLFFLKLVAEV